MSILRVTTAVSVTQDSMEMDTTAQVCYICTCNIDLCALMFTSVLCADVDECLADNSTCPSESDCENTFGSFSCKCEPGFIYDGDICEGIIICRGDKPRSHVHIVVQ